MSVRCRFGFHRWNRPEHDIWQAWEYLERTCLDCGKRKMEHCDRQRHYEEHHEDWTDDE